MDFGVIFPTLHPYIRSLFPGHSFCFIHSGALSILVWAHDLFPIWIKSLHPQLQNLVSQYLSFNTQPKFQFLQNAFFSHNSSKQPLSWCSVAATLNRFAITDYKLSGTLRDGQFHTSSLKWAEVGVFNTREISKHYKWGPLPHHLSFPLHRKEIWQ